MGLDDAQCNLPSGGREGIDLLDDIQTVALVLHHLLEPAHLALHPAKAEEEIILIVCVAGRGSSGHRLPHLPSSCCQQGLMLWAAYPIPVRGGMHLADRC